jgi:hypothetical protein
MIITRQQLQQLINEEFSRVIRERRRRSLTAYKVGDVVRSTVDAQGMKKGQEYKVVDVKHGKWGTVIYGIKPVAGADDELLWIGNGHLLLEPVDSDAFDVAVNESSKLYERHRSRGALHDLYELSGLDLVDFALMLTSLGDAVVEQLFDILSGDYRDVNPAVIDVIDKELGGINRDIDEAIQDFREYLQFEDMDHDDDGG